MFENESLVTLNFFPSSSILYSVTVFIFPLMVSFGDGRVPVNTQQYYDTYVCNTYATLY